MNPILAFVYEQEVSG